MTEEEKETSNHNDTIVDIARFVTYLYSIMPKPKDGLKPVGIVNEVSFLMDDGSVEVHRF